MGLGLDLDLLTVQGSVHFRLNGKILFLTNSLLFPLCFRRWDVLGHLQNRHLWEWDDDRSPRKGNPTLINPFIHGIFSFHQFGCPVLRFGFGWASHLIDSSFSESYDSWLLSKHPLDVYISPLPLVRSVCERTFHYFPLQAHWLKDYYRKQKRGVV